MVFNKSKYDVTLVLQTAVDEVKCGSCYGAQQNETHCCNTCQDVIDAYREKRWSPNTDSFEQCKQEGFIDKDLSKTAFTEGCQIYGHLEVNRVSWNLFRTILNPSIDGNIYLILMYLDGRQLSCGARQEFLAESRAHP